jgi:hypothetical protein
MGVNVRAGVALLHEHHAGIHLLESKKCFDVKGERGGCKVNLVAIIDCPFQPAKKDAGKLSTQGEMEDFIGALYKIGSPLDASDLYRLTGCLKSL